MSSENNLGLSWRDSNWISILNQTNVLDYFADRTNPFYDKSCNNETIKMQRLNLTQLRGMTGIEYILLHVQEPILYVIRKQHRHSEEQVTPLNDYYIIDGTVYQAPDLGTVINSRLLNTVHSLQAAFEEAQSYSRYHPSKGYWWEFTKEQEHTEKNGKEKKKKEESSSYFQRQRVDVLLAELAKKFPPKMPSQQQDKPVAEEVTVKQEQIKQEVHVKSEKVDVPQTSAAANKPPPEKKPKMIR